MPTPKARVAAIAATAVPIPLLVAGPAAADSWHYYEGTASKGTKHERLYVREQGKNRKKVTAYWDLHNSDAGPICYRGTKDRNPDYYRVYHGTWTATMFPSGKWVTKPTTFWYAPVHMGRKSMANFSSDVTPRAAGWMREQIWPGLPKGARFCFR